MTTFKDGGGAASDPYSGDDDEEGGQENTQRDEGIESSRTSAEDVEMEGDDQSQENDASGSAGLPWIYERTGITDGRERTVQLHLQGSTVDEEDDAQSDLKDLLGEKPQKADLREATHLVGMQHLDEVADQLREWGYDFE